MGSDKPIITTLAPWFGGKRNLAPEIVAEVGPHRVWWDVMCGGVAVTLLKPPCVMETINDLHGDVTNLARVVRDPIMGPKLYRRLRRTWMVEDVFREAADRIRASEAPEGPDADRAADYMLATWLGRNGVAGTASYNHHFCVRYTASGGHAAKRWDSVIRSIPAWTRRLRNVTILRRDTFKLLPRIEDRGGTVIYVDPPYVEKGALYVHDFGEADHRRLAEELHRFKETRVVVSYYDHPFVDELYEGWTKRVFEVSKALAHAGRRGKNDTKAREVLLINGPSLVEPRDRVIPLFGET